MRVELEISNAGQWEKAGSVSLLGEESSGTTGSCLLEYDNKYAFKYLSELGSHALSLRYPVNFAVEREGHWPAFLLDLMPSGAARRILEKKLKIKNSKIFDWKLLNAGGSNPIGNIRVKPTQHTLSQNNKHEGFDLAQVLDKQEGFIEYALSCGAPVSGTTGVAGDAPKFTLSKSFNGKWHPGGSISSSLVESEWIIKFLRGRTKADHVILESEAELYRLAEDLGLRGGYRPTYQDNALLIPRFDCIKIKGNTHRLGVESLYSAMGVYEFGVSASQENALRTIHAHSSSPMQDLSEFIQRDIFNYLISNTDNHGRNTSFIKYEDGRIELSPIYDCAPMKLDPQMITRSITWDDIKRNSKISTLPDYGELWRWLRASGIESDKIEQDILNFKTSLQSINFKNYHYPTQMARILEENRPLLIRAIS
ncbi:MAG: type II toxin-antitoxin system HipA family toxin [Planctomycetes bacterium]|nr:type II toxin-antitoxin system HipA family toxin [Planctomycetota bacterium]